MQLSLYNSAKWFDALTLRERVQYLNKSEIKNCSNLHDNVAQRKLEKWQAQLPFTEKKFFVKRLAIDELSEDEFRYLLAEDSTCLKARFNQLPPWLKLIQDAYVQAQNKARQPVTSQKTILDVLNPLITYAQTQLKDKFEVSTKILASSSLQIDINNILDTLSQSLFRSLEGVLSRTLILELNIARLRGTLSGDSPEQRYQNFLEQLSVPDVSLEFLAQYPVLARQVAIYIERWIVVNLEWFNRLIEDWSTIRDQFSVSLPINKLIEARGGVGDLHNGGRSVIMLTFESGWQLVYKPRSLGLEKHFQELLSWLNENGVETTYKTVTVLDCSTYGWMEFVSPKTCYNPEEVKRFYRRQGGYLALLHVLNAADLHFENLIAVGEYPILIDLEALFHPVSFQGENDNPDSIVTESLRDSVLRIGLLPTMDSNAKGSMVINWSGLSAPANQWAPRDVLHVENIGTDSMQIVRKPQQFGATKHQPTLNNQAVDVLGYKQDLLLGFTSMYHLLAQKREMLLSVQGPLMRFVDDKVRVIIRPTLIYGTLLMESFHPSLMQSALDRDRFYDQLWVNVPDVPYLERIIPYEHADLQNADIPLFTTTASSRHIWSSSGQCIPNMIKDSGLDLVSEHLSHLSETDLNRQLWFINASLATLSKQEFTNTERNARISFLSKTNEYGSPLAVACAIGDRLEELAVQEDSYAFWMGLTLGSKNAWALSEAGIDLYDGLTGIILYLAYLGTISNKERYTLLAQAGLKTLRYKLQSHNRFSNPLGLFNGLGGVIYTLLHLAKLWNQPELITEAENLVGLMAEKIMVDRQFDVIAGSAGGILALLNLYEDTSSEEVLKSAVQMGKNLLAFAEKMPKGIGWKVQGNGNVPLTGFAHGAAGIACALLKLSQVTGESSFSDAGLSALDYERSLFSVPEKNWPDMRKVEDVSHIFSRPEQYQYITAWCYGAAGIGLSRLFLLQNIKAIPNSEYLHQEVKIALENTINHSFIGKYASNFDHSLCHGDLGNLELLAQADKIYKDATLESTINVAKMKLMDIINRCGWLCSTPDHIETPGLMLGLSGIGYGFLRLAAPSKVPCLLLLETPIADKP
jgi:type 2 lantibiotic biosynthesis protein LanM